MKVTSSAEFDRSMWQTIAVLVLGFWLSSSLFLDLIIMPGMYAGGMMSMPTFASTGYSIFWIFNRVEVLCATLVLTSILVIHKTQVDVLRHRRLILSLALALLAIALVYTYALTPVMSALGVQLNMFEPISTVPALMDRMHEGYWALECIKLLAAGLLFGLCYRLRSTMQPSQS